MAKDPVYTTEEDSVLRACRLQAVPLGFEVIAQRIVDAGGAQRTVRALSHRWKQIRPRDDAWPAGVPKPTVWAPRWTQPEVDKLRELVAASNNPRYPDWQAISADLKAAGFDRDQGGSERKWKSMIPSKKAAAAADAVKDEDGDESGEEGQECPEGSSKRRLSDSGSSPKNKKRALSPPPTANPLEFDNTLLTNLLFSFGLLQSAHNAFFHDRLKTATSTAAEMCLVEATMDMLPQKIEEEVDRLRTEAKEGKVKIAEQLRAVIKEWEEK